MTRNHKRNAFTLIEVLLVFAIVSLLSSIILASTKSSKDRARTAKSLEFSQTVYHRLGAEAVGIWNFEEGSGTTVNDASGFNNHGTITNGEGDEWSDITPYDEVGQGTGRYSISFDGINDYVNCGNNASLNPTTAITVEAWIKVSQFKSVGSALSDPIIGKWNYAAGNMRGYDLRFYNGNPRPQFVVTDGVNYDTLGFNGFDLSVGNWYHVVGVWSPGGTGNLKIYVNTQLTQKTNSYTFLGISSNSLHLGHNIVNAAYFNGLIDDVHIYNQSLTSAEIQKHYAEGLKKYQLAEK